MNNKKRIFALIFLILLILLFIFFLKNNNNSEVVSKNTTSLVAQESTNYFEMLRESQLAIRQSPDHLSAKYHRIVSSGTADELIHFIRDSFDVMPPTMKGWDYSVQIMRWGKVGTLRAGAGTPRALAELLKDALKQMGYAAKVVVQDTPTELRTFLRKKESRDFAPGIEAQPYQKLLSGKTLTPAKTVKNQPQFWNKVEDLIPAKVRRKKAFNPNMKFLPTVLFSKLKSDSVDSGAMVLANLWGKDSSTTSPSKYHNTGNPYPIPNVEISLLLALSKYPNSPVELLKKTWTQQQLAGKRISASFLPVTGSLESLLSTPPNQFTNFIPMLKVDNPLPEISEEEAFSEGKPFNINGQMLNYVGDKLNVGDKILATGGDPNNVTKIVIHEVNTAHFPWMKLLVDVVDENGNSVEAITAENFKASINQIPAGLSIHQNIARAPKIIFLADTSASVDPMYLNENLYNLVKELAEKIQKQAPGAEFRAGIVEGNSASFLGWSSSPQKVARDTQHRRDDSALWRAYAAAIQEQPDVIIFITDGVAASRKFGYVNSMPDELKSVYKLGPPAIMLGAGSKQHPLGAAFKGIAENSGGVALDISDKEQAILEVMHQISQRKAPYEIWVRADTNQLSASTLELNLTLKKVSDSKIVNIPDGKEISPPPSINGIYLKIKTADGTTIRTLAGNHYKSQKTSPESQKNARLGLFGKYTLMVEAGAPNLSIILDEVITAKLSWEDVINASTKKELKEALSRVKQLPSSAFSFSIPLFDSSNKKPIYETGLRYWLQSNRRVIHDRKEYAQTRVDLIPLTRFFSINPDANEAFKATLRGTAMLSEVESTLYPQSTLNNISENMKFVEYSVEGKQRKAQLQQLTAGWPHYEKYLVPSEGDINSGIGVDSQTGTVISILYDGSGGGITEAETNRKFDAIDALLDEVGSYTSGAPAFWAKLQKAKMAKLRVATISIIKMESPDLDSIIHDDACAAASGVADSIVEAGVRAVGGESAVDLLDSLSDSVEYFDTYASSIGMGSIDASIHIPGCD